jgi:hypothetical protein
MHIVEESRQVGAADLLETELVGNPDQMLAIHVNLQTRRLSYMHVRIN